MDIASQIGEQKIVITPISQLRPYSNNSRTHSKAQIQKIANSIREFGFTNPILIDKEKTVIAGHARLEAAKRIKIKEVPTICLEHLDENQAKAYVIADNQLAFGSSWNDQMLANEFLGLKESGFDMDLLGFKETKIDKVLSDAGLIDNIDAIADEFINPEEEYLVIVECKNEEEQQSIFTEMKERGIDCRVI